MCIRSIRHFSRVFDALVACDFLTHELSSSLYVVRPVALTFLPSWTSSSTRGAMHVDTDLND